MANCKTCEYEDVCVIPHFKNCIVYEEKKQQSQADRIRAMSDEELAEFLTDFSVCEKCEHYEGEMCNYKHIPYGLMCTNDVVARVVGIWLKAEVKE